MRSLRILFVPFCLALAACPSSTGPTPDDMAMPPADLTPPLGPIGVDTTVTLFDHVAHPAGHITNDSVDLMLPTGLFQTVTLHVALTCPGGGCDPYDRIASIGFVEGGGDGGVEQVTEIGRYITPFGIKGSWDIDVTDLQPLLTTTRRFRSYIETYAGGWVVTAQLIYKGGIPTPIPVAAIALPWSSMPVGSPAKASVDTSLVPTMVTLPAGVTSAAVRLFVTGHGQGNSENCAEFCDLEHSLLADGKLVESTSIWRDDCDQNPLNNQKGSWQYPREGWCPGSDVKPWKVDLSKAVSSPTTPFRLSYGEPSDQSGAMPVSYENTCQPDDCQQNTCAFGNPCAYDNGAHTEPRFLVSAVVIGYR